MSIEQQARELLRALCLLPIRAGQEAEIALIVAALASQPQAPAAAVPEDVHKSMAAEYQAWIDFFHRGDGDYDDFLRAHVFPAAPAPEVSR